MHEVITDEDLADERLAELARAGEESAFNQLYERWSEPLHDFAARIMLDRSRAPAVVRRAFAATLSRRRPGPEVEHVVPSLYGVAQRDAVRRARRRRSRDVGDADFLRLDESLLMHPESGVPEPELVAIVWGVAAALPAADYALLDLHLRQELTAVELARMLDLSREVVCERLADLRDALDSAALGVDVGRPHRVSGVEVFGALALVPAPASGRDAKSAWKRRRRPLKLVAAGALAVATLGGAAAAMTLVGDDDPVLREPAEARGASPSGKGVTPRGSSPRRAATEHAKARARSRARRRRRRLARKTASSGEGTVSVAPAPGSTRAPRQGTGGQRRSGDEDQPGSRSPRTKRESATDSKPSPAPELQPAPSDPPPQQEVVVPADPKPPSDPPTTAPAR